MARPVPSNTSVTIDAAGIPTFSNTIPSSTLPDEQDPQSPMPATTTSTPRFASSMISWWAGTLELCLRHIVHSRSEEHTSELQSRSDLVCRLLLEKKTLF